jgi:hypothetical protein
LVGCYAPCIIKLQFFSPDPSYKWQGRKIQVFNWMHSKKIQKYSKTLKLAHGVTLCDIVASKHNKLAVRWFAKIILHKKVIWCMISYLGFLPKWPCWLQSSCKLTNNHLNFHKYVNLVVPNNIAKKEFLHNEMIFHFINAKWD